MRGLRRILGWLRRILGRNWRLAGLAGSASARFLLTRAWICWIAGEEDTARSLSGSKLVVFHSASKRLMHGHRK